MLTSIAKIARRIANAVTSYSGVSTDPRWIGPMMDVDKSAARVDHDSGLTHSSVWRCVAKLTNAVAKTPLVVSRLSAGDDFQPDRIHPGYKLLRSKPNPIVTAFNFKRAMTFGAVWWGNAVAYIQRDIRGNPVALWMFRHGSVGQVITPGVGGTITLEYFAYSNGRKFPMQAKDVLHIRGLSNDGIWGLPVIEYIRHTLGLGISARRFGSQFFERGANPSGIVNLPLTIDNEEAANLFIASFKERYEKLGSAFSTMFLADGATYQALQVPPDDAQFLATREFSDREIANFFGFPPASVGVSESVSYNSFEVSKQFELDEGISPWFAQWETECEDKLLTASERESETVAVRFQTEELLRVDFKTKHEVLVKDVNEGLATLNEARRRLHLPRIDHPLADTPRMPRNIGYIDSEDIQISDSRQQRANILIAKLLEPATPPELTSMAKQLETLDATRRSKRWLTNTSS